MVLRTPRPTRRAGHLRLGRKGFDPAPQQGTAYAFAALRFWWPIWCKKEAACGLQTLTSQIVSQLQLLKLPIDRIGPSISHLPRRPGANPDNP
ncbi:hypothetical protein BOSEA31B_10601 [Hyphomicrobiales bacterium]|nr:hypothetical protein BOSEA31B_10601 [Hyphomicrobiales bacterium]CAH1700456.1 hypothetical protein BOSEA1005_20155 [Hyphomicrobiales bacterium]CAI0343663.1 hypothetical protein BO1005MUT1_280165 [Hyphomicrobiales bacterium]